MPDTVGGEDQGTAHHIGDGVEPGAAIREEEELRMQE